MTSSFGKETYPAISVPAGSRLPNFQHAYFRLSAPIASQDMDEVTPADFRFGSHAAHISAFQIGNCKVRFIFLRERLQFLMMS